MSRHILITGGAGFIGSHLSDAHIVAGDHVTVLDNFSTGRRENIAHLLTHDRFHLEKGSITDASLVEKCISRSDRVYHLAAAVGVKHIVDHPLESLRTNIDGTMVVLEAARRHQKKILITSTSEIYGKNTKDMLDEDDDRILGSPLKSRWGYSSAKAIDELLGYLYYREYSVPVVLVRLFNTVGPRQTGMYGMVIPRFVTQALHGESLTVYGTGKQLRSFLHVEDCLRALLELMETDDAVGKVFNIGNEEEVSIENLAKKIIAMTESASSIVRVPYSAAYGEGFEDMQRRHPSTTRLHTLTGWTPTLNLEKILHSVISHIRTTASSV